MHPLRAFSEAAQARSEIWRTFLGFAMAVGLIFLFGVLTRIGVHASLNGLPEGQTLGELLRDVQAEIASPSSALSMLVILATFAAVWPALWVVVRVVHKRRGSTLFGPSGRINWRHFRIGLGISLAVGAAAWLPLLLTKGTAGFEIEPLALWLPLLAMALPLVFVQCAAEELFFRGYLLQQIAARSWSILGWSILPSALFALAHPDPDGILGMSWYHFVFGLVMAAITSRTANLGAAIGIHFGNNIINLLLISATFRRNGLALFTYPEGMDIRPALYTYIGVMFVGATIFMATMDLKFLRAWKAQERYRVSKGAEPRPAVVLLPRRWFGKKKPKDKRPVDPPPQSAAS